MLSRRKTGDKRGEANRIWELFKEIEDVAWKETMRETLEAFDEFDEFKQDANS